MSTENFRIAYTYLFKARRRWTTASEIYDATNVSPKALRALCQEYPSIFIGSPSGYKLALMATPSEIRACVQSLLGRAEKIMSRASALSGRLA